jgi:hypothetical protein
MVPATCSPRGAGAAAPASGGDDADGRADASAAGSTTLPAAAPMRRRSAQTLCPTPSVRATGSGLIRRKQTRVSPRRRDYV